MSSLPSFCASTRSRSNSCGVRWTRLARRRVHRALLEVDVELADLDHRLAATARRAAARRAAGRAARRSRTASSRSRRRRRRARRPSRAPRRPPRARSPAPSLQRAQLAADVDAACRPAARGRGSPRRAGASPPRRAPPRRSSAVVDLVAGAAQARPQRAQDLRLVVDDEDARPAHASAPPAPRRRAARARTSRPGPAATRPRRGRRSPRRSRARSRARGRRRGRAVRAPRWNGSKIRSQLRPRARPGPWSIDAHEHLLPASPSTCTRTGSARRRELERVLEQVHEHALDLLRVDAHRRRVVGQRRPRRARRRRRARRAPARRGRRPARPRARAAPRRPASRERSSRLPTRRSRRSASARIVSSSSRGRRRSSSRSSRASALAEVEDRHQRRAQVVADRAQDRRLDRVAPAQRLGLERLALQALAVDRDGEQRRERGQEPPPRGGARRAAALEHGSCRRADRPRASGVRRPAPWPASPSTIVARSTCSAAPPRPRSGRARRATSPRSSSEAAISASSAASLRPAPRARGELADDDRRRRRRRRARTSSASPRA